MTPGSPAIEGLLIYGFKSLINRMGKLYLPIRPITLLFGQNAAGKSSLLQAMAWMHDLHHGGRVDAYRLRLTGSHVNLGGFRSLRTRAGLKAAIEDGVPETPVFLGWSFRLTDRVWPGLWRAKHVLNLPDSEKWSINYRFDRDEGSDPFLSAVVIEMGDAGIYFTGPDEDGAYRSIGHGLTPTQVLEVLTRHGGEDLDTARFSREVDQQLTGMALRLKGLAPQLEGSCDPDCCGPARAFVENLQRALQEMGQAIDSFLGEPGHPEVVEYLGPWRKIPDEADLAGAGLAGDRPELRHWASLFSGDIRKEVNDWLKRLECMAEVAEVQYIDRDHLFGYLKKIWNDDIDDADKLLRLIEEDLEGAIDANPPRLILRVPGENIQVTPDNTGVGISQLIPVIVAALAKGSKTLMVEQPELHLHPRLQAEMGDLLIEAAGDLLVEAAADARTGKCIIVETHSEHLILRLLRRVRETAARIQSGCGLKPQDLSVVYVGRTELGTVEPSKKWDIFNPVAITELPVTDAGDFGVKWPEGFFEDRMKEIFSAEELERWYQES